MADLRIGDYALLRPDRAVPPAVTVSDERVVVWAFSVGEVLVERDPDNVPEGEQRIVWVARERLTNVPERAAA